MARHFLSGLNSLKSDLGIDVKANPPTGLDKRTKSCNAGVI